MYAGGNDDKDGVDGNHNIYANGTPEHDADEVVMILKTLMMPDCGHVFVYCIS